MTVRLALGVPCSLLRGPIGVQLGVLVSVLCVSCHRAPILSETRGTADRTAATSNLAVPTADAAGSSPKRANCILDESDEIQGVEASSVSEVVVAWSRNRVSILGEARELLDGKDPVGAVTVGTDGSVYAIRGTKNFGVAARSAIPVWRKTPVTGQTLALQVFGDWVAWLVQREDLGPVLALTRNQGRSWTLQPVPELDEGRLHLAADGTLDLVARIYDCHGGDYALHYTGRAGVHRWREVPWPTPGYSEASSIGHDGFAYSTHTVSGREWTYALSHEAQKVQLVRLLHGKETVVDASVPDDLRLEAVDSRGRPLGVSGGRVWIWSPANGWESLTECGLPSAPASPSIEHG
jgi:hypothetical protein